MIFKAFVTRLHPFIETEQTNRTTNNSQGTSPIKIDEIQILVDDVEDQPQTPSSGRNFTVSRILATLFTYKIYKV